MPRISVIVPVYKVEPYLRRCVDSILGQTFDDFELILVNDGSPDNCPEICNEYAQKDPRVIVIHQKNGGLSAARNAGIDWAFANSDSQWLNFIDSDDWVHPEYLERLFNAASDSNVEISVCTLGQVHGCAPKILPEELTVNIWRTADYFMQKSFHAISACAKLYRKSLFANIRYPLGRLHEDEFTTPRVLFLVEQVVVMEAPLYFNFYNVDGITKAPWTPRRLDMLDACEERMIFFQELGNNQMFQYTVGVYLSYVYLTKEKIKRLGDKILARKYDEILRRRVRKIIQKYDEISMTLNSGLYEFAYPNLMRFYWYAVSFKKKLCSVLGCSSSIK